MGDVNELLEEVIKETENLNEGEVFLVKDLFKGMYGIEYPERIDFCFGLYF